MESMISEKAIIINEEDSFEIKSNTKGKLKRIIDGLTFENHLTFITEFLQNAYRARCKNLHINITDMSITFYDDGKGLDNAKDILTLDYSSWPSTKEGYGIGFWSWLALKEVTRCAIESNNFKIMINVLDILNEEKPKAASTKLDISVKGFKVTLYSQYFNDSDNKKEAYDRIKEEASFQPYNTYINDVYIEKKDLFAEVTGEYSEEFHNKLFDAKLCVSEDYAYPKVYYEKRVVCNIYASNGFTKGVIELKNGIVSLKEPDRKEIIYDDKRTRFENKVNECIKTLYKDFIESYPEKINKYSNNIDCVLNPQEYEKYLNIDDLIEEFSESSRDICNISEENNNKKKAFETLSTMLNTRENDSYINTCENNLSSEDNLNIGKMLNTISDYKWMNTEMKASPNEVELKNITADDLETLNKVNIGGILWEKVNYNEENIDYTEDDKVCTQLAMPIKSIKKKKTTIKQLLNKYSLKTVWIPKDEIDDYEDLKQELEYYRVKVLTAKNVLYEKVFKEHNIPCISEITVEETFKRQNICIKTEKEKNFLKILTPLCKYFKLPLDTFAIGNLELIVEVKQNERVLNRKLKKNSKEIINVHAVTAYDINKIIFDRRALNLARFNLSYQSDGLSKGEYKVLMCTIDTIAHELAHLLFKTKDNTLEHYRKEESLREEIKNFYALF